ATAFHGEGPSERLWLQRPCRLALGGAWSRVRRVGMPGVAGSGGAPRGRSPACAQAPTVCAPASGGLSHRSGKRRGGRVDVRVVAQAPVASLVAPAGAGSAVGGARGTPRARNGVAGGDMPRRVGRHGRGGVAHRLSKLSADTRAAATESGSGGVAAEEAR